MPMDDSTIHRHRIGGTCVTRALLVANPRAGSMASACDPEWSRWRLKALGWDVATAPDQMTPETDEAWQRAVAEADVVVAMGGDGTIRRLLPYLIAHPTPLAIVPCGTGNDLARSLGLPLDPVLALEIAHSGMERRIDLATVNGLPFVNVASLGVSAAVSISLTEETKKRFGTFAYRLAVVREVWRRPPLSLSLYANGKRHRLTAYQVSIANGVSFGGGWSIAADASLDDHALDIVVIGPMPLADRWRRWREQSQGGLAGTMAASESFRAPSCRIEARQPLVVNLDGDPVELNPPLRVTVLPCALSVIVPVPSPVENT
jgi:YegS/Rv2252/BmrU family lipid kinase